MTEYWQLGAHSLAQLYATGQASPVEVLESSLERIRAVDERVGAFACVLDDAARSAARQRTDELAKGVSRGPLHGVPVAVKELFDVEGAPGDYGSDVLSGRVATSDAELVGRLRQGGALIIGTTRSHEFGWGITTQHERRGGTRNPWNLDRIPGGSSGGSGAAVVSGMVPVAVGSDTGGSIRIPASFCGVAGLKPTFGRVSRTGGVALAPSLDTPGALGRTIEDAAVVVQAMSGSDGVDPACSDLAPPEVSLVPSSLDGVRIGVSADLMGVGLDASIAAVFDAAVSLLGELGAEVVEVAVPDAESIRAAFVPFQMAEAYHVHHRSMGLYPQRASDYGSDVRSRLEAASEVSVGDYLAAREQRHRIVAAFERRLRSVDAILSPVSGVGPSRVDDCDRAAWNGQMRPLRDAVMPFTVPHNMTGLPTSVVPAGVDSQGLPVGVQLMAARWREDKAVEIAAALQLAQEPLATTLPELVGCEPPAPQGSATALSADTPRGWES